MTFTMMENLPEQEYHAIEALGSTSIKNMAVSPAHFQMQKLAMEGVEKDAFAIGSMFHQRVLEPDRDEFIAAPELDRRTKEGKAAYAEFAANSEGKTVLKKADFDNTCAMVEAFRQTDAYANMMNGEVSTEVSVVGPEKKARFDLLKKHPKGFYIAYDLKTTSREFPQTERDWQRWFIKWGYYMQAAWYIHVASLAGIKIAAFNFIVVSTKAPYEHAVLKINDEFLEAGTEKVLAAFDLYKKCLKEDRWPGAFEMQGKPVLEIPLPTWGLA